MLGRKLIFFDSECATCHGVVRFLLRRPSRNRFLFIPIRVLLESSWKDARDAQGAALTGDSIVVLSHGLLLQKSAAILSICVALGWPWRIFAVFKIVPRPLLDFFYELFARNRYKLFGKADPAALCELPDPEERKLFAAEIPESFFHFPKRSGVFLQAEWINLVFLNYEVPETLLSRYLPEHTELDLWQGKAFCSIVAFEMNQTRVAGLAVPFHEDFEEVNLRFYVRRRVLVNGVEELRRGVVFVKEIVPRFAIAAIARLFYNENYSAAQMSHHHSFGKASSCMNYAWQSPRGGCQVKAQMQGQAEPAGRGSLEEFITEHYWGYARQKNGSTVEYEVEHPSWLLWKDVKAELIGPIEADYGEEFAAYLKSPVSICAAVGSSVRVFRGRSI